MKNSKRNLKKSLIFIEIPKRRLFELTRNLFSSVFDEKSSRKKEQNSTFLSSKLEGLDRSQCAGLDYETVEIQFHKTFMILEYGSR